MLFPVNTGKIQTPGKELNYVQVLRTKTICGLVSEKLVLWCDALFKKVTIMFSSHGNRTEVFNQILLKGENEKLNNTV